MDWKKLLISIVACELLGNIGSLFTMPSIGTWYATLAKPTWTPPNWLFGPVWTTLFFLMGIALYLVWTKKPKVLPVFWIQFALNILWSALFFGLKSPLYGFIGIIVLWTAILLNIFVFYKVDRRAGYVLIPYLAWVTIATALNYSVLVLNL
jgi:tryptophan-rich sensory protein